ncbi:CBS domain-containing protein [Pirellulales bacterium]|nr:CBS domain-containing protein [Pirellulales bacterium]
MTTAREIMTENVTTIKRDCSIEDAISLLLEKQVSGLPVVDDFGHLVGIVTEYALLAIAYDQSVLQDSVELHMTTDVLSVGVDDPINTAADLCIAHRVRRLPVMDGDRLVGLISRRDVLTAIHRGQFAAVGA